MNAGFWIVAIWCTFSAQFDFLNYMIVHLSVGDPILETFLSSPAFQTYAWNQYDIAEGYLLIFTSILWDIAIFRTICHYAIRRYQRQSERQTLD